MAIRSKSAFQSLYLTSSGTWPNNITGEITPADLRAGIQDYFDSQTNFWPLDSSGIIGSDSASGLIGVDFASGLAAPVWREGRVFYDSANHTFAVYTDKSSVTLQLGQETHIRAVNKTGATIPDGTVVAITGAQGNRPTIEPAIATHTYSHIEDVIGLTTHEALINEEVLVTINGTIGYDTRSFDDGDDLFLSPTISGGITNTQPQAPHHTVHIGHALNSTVNGKILVHIDANPDLESLSNVDGVVPVEGSLLAYNGASGFWNPTTQVTLSSGIIVIPKESGYGMKINPTDPAYGWRDITSLIQVRSGATVAPDWVAYRGEMYAYQFVRDATPDEVFCEYHIPHDYVLGSNLYVHTHWSQNIVDTAGLSGVPGNVQWTYYISYADGHGTAGGTANPFNAPIVISGTQQGSTTQYGHMIHEVPFTSVGGVSGLIDVNRIHVDGIVLVKIARGATGSLDTLNQAPFMHFADLHYQSNNVPTKNKSPNFYL